MTRRFYCTDLRKDFPDIPYTESCCDSCHDDFNYHGFDHIEVCTNGKVYEVCCSVSRDAESITHCDDGYYCGTNAVKS